MVFSSVSFLFLFLPWLLLLYYIAPGNSLKNSLLLIASLFFYAWGESFFVLIMILSCLWNYGMGLIAGGKKFRKTGLIIGVAGNVFLLLYYKYFTFLIDSLNAVFFTDNPIIVSKVHLPIGISFFTFQGLSYVIDVYRNETEAQKNPLRLALFISLFPQLIAGPIVRYVDVASQMGKRIFSNSIFLKGVETFIIGLGKKVLIANVMGLLADEIMKHPVSELSTGAAWLGIIAYALQIFFDFSGYSDMAIGLGRMFGFEFLPNFNYPYISKSIREFWRRWHISLSTWFRDYLYIPLGGSQHGPFRTYFNLLVVFFITGLWHGASWSFVFWGLFHGFFIVVERLGFDKILKKIGFLSHVYTLLVALTGWVFFRLTDFGMAWDYLSRMFNPFPEKPEFPFLLASEMLNPEYLLTLFAGIIFSLPHNWLTDRINSLVKVKSFAIASVNTVKWSFLIMVFIYSAMALSSNTYNPFIYFRF